jgi:hypothetical protein
MASSQMGGVIEGQETCLDAAESPGFPMYKASSGNKWTNQRRLRLGWSV